MLNSLYSTVPSLVAIATIVLADLGQNISNGALPAALGSPVVVALPTVATMTSPPP